MVITLLFSISFVCISMCCSISWFCNIDNNQSQLVLFLNTIEHSAFYRWCTLLYWWPSLFVSAAKVGVICQPKTLHALPLSPFHTSICLWNWPEDEFTADVKQTHWACWLFRKHGTCFVINGKIPGFPGYFVSHLQNVLTYYVSVYISTVVQQPPHTMRLYSFWVILGVTLTL